MAKAGRRPNLTGPRVRWDFYLRADIAATCDLLLADPTRERVKYGARSDLVEALLEKWIAQQRKEAGLQEEQFSQRKLTLDEMARLIANSVPFRVFTNGEVRFPAVADTFDSKPAK